MHYLAVLLVCVYVGTWSMATESAGPNNDTAMSPTSPPSRTASSTLTEVSPSSRAPSMANTTMPLLVEHMVTGKTYYIAFITSIYDAKQVIDGNIETLTYIDSFENVLQRAIIRKQLEVCPFVELCGYSLPALGTYERPCCENCSCDVATCLQDNSCCPDAVDMGNLASIPTNLHACIPPHLTNILYGHGYEAIIKCPKNEPQDLNYNCTRWYTGDIKKLADVVPCYSRDTSKLYRNMYCALCNGERRSNLEYVDVKFLTTALENSHVLSEEEMIKLALISYSVTLEFQIADYMGIATCDVDIIDTCNVTGDWRSYNASIELACLSYKSDIRHESTHTSYRNVFCAMCNGVDIDGIYCYNTAFSDPESTPDVFSFSGLLSFNNDDHDEAVTQRQGGGRCNSLDQYYDVLQDRCRDIVCSDMYVLKDGKCVEGFRSIDASVVYNAYVRFVPLRNTTIGEVYNATNKLVLDMRSKLGSVFKSHLCNVTIMYVLDIPGASKNAFTIMSIPHESRLLYIDTRLKTLTQNEGQCSSTTKLTADLKSVHNTVISIGSTDSDIQFTTKVLQNNDFDMESSPQVLNETSFIDEFEHFSPLVEESLLVALTLTDELGRTRLTDIWPAVINKYCQPSIYGDRLHLELLKVGECPKIHIHHEDVRWYQKDDYTLEFGEDAFAIDSDLYIMINETSIAMCIETYETYVAFVLRDDKARNFTAKTIISYICSAISILALTFTIVTFCLFRKLRHTVPGKNNMTLASMMLCANTAFIISSVGNFSLEPALCKIIGCVVHLFWLLSMFWMNICTYHMYRVLTKTKSITAASGWKKCLIYHAYATIMSLVFIAINMTTSTLTTGDIGYGGQTCYISTPVMILYTFALPTAFVILSNVVMFCLVIHAIRRSSGVQKNVQNERNDLLIFAKLSTITGITWVVGLVNIWANNEVLEYIFILFNAGQGLLIFMAFVVNRAVWVLYKHLFSEQDVSTFNSGYSSRSTRLTTD